MITLEWDYLAFRFPEVHQDAVCSIGFQRTLRIPDDGKDYPLPPGLGCFPVRHVDDFAETVPRHWLTHGGVMTPIDSSVGTSPPPWTRIDSTTQPSGRSSSMVYSQKKSVGSRGWSSIS